MFDNTVPVATNAQCVSWHMFEPNPNVLVIMFAGLHQGDGDFCETENTKLSNRGEKGGVDGKKNLYLVRNECF